MGWYRADLLGNRIVFTDRRGGFSVGPFASLNLSVDTHDPAVPLNRDVAGALVGVAPDHWVPMRQVHGTSVVVDEGVGERPEADAVVLTEAGAAGLVLTADCAPVALVHDDAVAAVHAGWGGLLAGVVAEGVAAMGPAPRFAVLGACIRPCCYEFGEDDLAPLVARFGREVRSTTTGGATAFDLPAAVKVALAEAGVTTVVDLGACTACSPDYFSYRRDGVTGRQGLLVTRLPA